jgi:hypothetical protein
MTSTDRPPVSAPTTGADTGTSTRVPGTRVPTLALAVLAAIAAWLSYASVRAAAVPVFGLDGGSAFPLLLDTGVFTASEYYLRSVRANRPMTGFRTLTRALIAATIAVNVSTAATPRAALLHAVPPALFAALVELRARQILGDARHHAGTPIDRIPLRLWLTSPIESFKLSLWVAKAASHTAARAERERHLVALRALKLALPGRGQARTARTLVRRQLRAGTLDPAVLVTATGLDQEPDGTGAAAVLRVALRAALNTATPHPANPGDLPESGEVPLPASPRHPRPDKANSRTRVARTATPDARTWEQLLDKAREVNAQAVEQMGAPAGVGRLKKEVGVGQERAQQLRDHLAATQVALPRLDRVAPSAPIEHANGTAV